MTQLFPQLPTFDHYSQGNNINIHSNVHLNVYVADFSVLQLNEIELQQYFVTSN